MGCLLALFHFRLARCHCGEPRLRGEANEKLGKSVDAKTIMSFLIWVRKPTNQMFAKKHACRTISISIAILLCFWGGSASKFPEGPLQNLMFCWDNGGPQSPKSKVHFPSSSGTRFFGQMLLPFG